VDYYVNLAICCLMNSSGVTGCDIIIEEGLAGVNVCDRGEGEGQFC